MHRRDGNRGVCYLNDIPITKRGKTKMKIRASQLKKLIKEAIEESQEVNEISATARVDKPLNDLVSNLNDAKKRLGKDGAKRAISDMLQAPGCRLKPRRNEHCTEAS